MMRTTKNTAVASRVFGMPANGNGYTEEEAGCYIAEKLNNRYWADRAVTILLSICRGRVPATVSDLEVSPGWPTKGEIFFTRDADHKRFHAFMIGNVATGYIFRCLPV